MPEYKTVNIFSLRRCKKTISTVFKGLRFFDHLGRVLLVYFVATYVVWPLTGLNLRATRCDLFGSEWRDVGSCPVLSKSGESQFRPCFCFFVDRIGLNYPCYLLEKASNDITKCKREIFVYFFIIKLVKIIWTLLDSFLALKIVLIHVGSKWPFFFIIYL